MATADIKVHTEAHHDDHDHEHEHHGNFWTNYVFCQDHKVIAKQFLITGMAWALIGGVLSVIFRLQLGFPDASLEWLRPPLGEVVRVVEEFQHRRTQRLLGGGSQRLGNPLDAELGVGL